MPGIHALSKPRASTSATPSATVDTVAPWFGNTTPILIAPPPTAVRAEAKISGSLRLLQIRNRSGNMSVMGTAAPDIVRTAYVDLVVTDLARARAFWVDLVGFH